MARVGQRGLSLVEVLVAMVVLGVGLGGLVGLLLATVQGEGEAGRHMAARRLALGALEQGAAPPGEETLRVEYRSGQGLREAQVTWREGVRPRSLSLHARCGRE